MTIFFAKSVNGFYDDEINTIIPEDAKEISSEFHMALINAQGLGKIITSNEEGYPILVDAPEPTEEEIATEKAKALKAELEAINYLFYDEQAGDVPEGTWKTKREEIKAKYK
jgi:hypothetical protein